MAKSFKLKCFLWAFNTFTKFDLKNSSASQIRDIADNRESSLMDGKPIQLSKVENLSITGRNGAIPIRIYIPTDAIENAPVITFYHGGGFVIGTLDTHDKVCRRLSKMNQAIVVAVDYRLAPEHKFPAAAEDCYDATQWVSENISKYGGDPQKLVVCGDSAGGNLATVTAIQARDLGTPKIACQVLVYPVTDARMGHPSITKNGKGYILTKELMEWFLMHYSREEGDKLNPLMSPLLTKDLSNLPPALVQTAGFDPLRDEGMDYVEKLKAAGNEVQHTNYEGLIHTYFTMPEFSKKCFSAHEEIASYLKNRLVS